MVKWMEPADADHRPHRNIFGQRRSYPLRHPSSRAATSIRSPQAEIRRNYGVLAGSVRTLNDHRIETDAHRGRDRDQ